MTAYINQLILTVVVCQTVSMFAPENESAKRWLHTVCALVTLITLLSPVQTIIGHGREIGERLSDFFSVGEQADTAEDSLRTAAQTIFAYAEDHYGFDTQGAELSFLTDENGRACELMIFFPEGSASERDRLQTELEKELGIVVHIFLERRDEDAAERKENTENG